MLRALAKATVLAGFGHIPGGAHAYQTLTRDWMGTQATHVDKLARVWPGYADVWTEVAGIELAGARIWVHEGGWTPFPFLATYLLTGDAGVVTNRRARMHDQYLARAVNGVLGCALPESAELDARRPAVERLRWFDRVADAIAEIGGELHERVALDAIPLPDESVDLCHSGGTLEHVHPDELRTFLEEAFRVLRPGGVMSHVFDHRDHLHHADQSWPFLWHLRLSPLVYQVLFGHPLLYHNRLLPGEVAGLFEAAGFECLAVRRMVLPAHSYIDDAADALAAESGIDRTDLADRFQSATDLDLRTAAAHYLYRKR